MIRLYTSLAVLLLSISCLSAQTQGPRSYNTTLFGTLNPASDNAGRYSALTGYAAPDGREYALLGGYKGTHIIDVTESPIREVAFIAGPWNGWREMKTYGHYAYVVSEGGSGLQIIDLSNLPASATLVRADTSSFRTAHTITQHEHYLYVNGTGVASGANGGTMIFDLAKDPTRPERIGMWTLRYVHDCTVRNDTMYAAAINNERLDIVYLGAGQKNPQLVTSIEYPGAGTHNSDLTPDGSYVMTTDEIGATPKTLKVWDVRDVDNIMQVADWTPVPGEIIHNVHVKGTVAYISWYTAGTRIVDMSDPAHPAQLGFYDTYEGASHDYAGNWGVYPYLPSGKILSSDMQTGLHVFTFNGKVRGSVHGRVLDAGTGAPVAGAVIEFAATGERVTSDDQGQYTFAGAAGTLQYKVSKTDYVTRSADLVLDPNDNVADIVISPLPVAVVTMNLVDSISSQHLAGFAYRVAERSALAGNANGDQQAFRLPKDSTYHIYVGAWGYRRQLVEIAGNQGGDYEIKMQREYADDAELDLGWSFSAPGDNATGGRWERGVPAESILQDSTVLQPNADNTPGLGTQAFITGLSTAADNVGANDVDEGSTTLTSPVMDLSTYNKPVINCSIWYSRDARFDAINDTLEVLISNDGGQSWKTMARIWESPGAWKDYSFQVKDFVAPSQRMHFRIVASDLYEQSLVEAGLDDFMVIDAEPGSASVPVAINTTGVVTFRQFRPNPFSGSAALDLDLGRDQRHARLELFDALGRSVVLLHEGVIAAGAHSYPINGASLPAGRYTWRLTLDDGAVVAGAATLVR